MARTEAGEPSPVRRPRVLTGSPQQLTGMVEARVGQPGHRRSPGRLAEAAYERTPGHSCRSRDRIEVDGLSKVAGQPGAQRRELVARGIWPQALDVLGLASGALRRRDA